MQQYEQATFAGGCFWCMVKPFDKYEGVINVISGYTGGHTENPTYQQVCQGNTGHTEAVQITFDPTMISYKKLLDIFWQQIDPTDSQGQFADRGDSYRPVIFYHNKLQQQQAITSKQALEESKRFNHPIDVAIEPAAIFYPAEAYHQDYYKKQPENYNRYYQLSGRANFIADNWQDKSTTKSE
ncbi:peptide-methionine (S)-S-oxide reductase MsrA [Gilliamella sp. B3023]|uniref:peptide-methionine (S)-S-oxide reductase MsrA n=1 Tax=Gilliamella sp. B3023 TaxID=2817987 RepID=UPI00226A9349|nr:peptide-methionine (S)-S-oxide reductase MsrA [Gilliamella sp. B3023]MCX8675405.1 peptide-methionine (S)-S-oxide reductase MsrA [Gilliamella sp. B3023]